MQRHDKSPRPDVVGEPGEADEDDGGHVVDDLLLEVLQERWRLQDSFLSPAPATPPSSPGVSVPHVPQFHPKRHKIGGRLFTELCFGFGASWHRPLTHLSLDIRGDAEEQGPVERKFDHVVPVLGGDGAL